MKQATAANHERAPLCAAFVEAMREAFGDVMVLNVRERDVKLGDEDQSVYASCMIVEKK